MTLIHIATTWLLANWFYIALFVAYILLHIAYGKRSQIDTWCNSRPRVAGIMKMVRAIFPDYWTFIQGISLIFLGKLPQSYVKIAENVTKVAILD